MATQFLIPFLFIFCYALTISGEESIGFVGSLDPKSIQKKHTLSHFRFYWHELFNGSNPTTVVIIPSLLKYNKTTSFGSVEVLDTALVVGPESNSKVVGRAEGLVASTSQSEFDPLVIMTFVLTEGKYNGSSITFLGRRHIEQKVREMPVIGGTGVFRFATGYVDSTTILTDPQTKNNVIEFNVYVYH